MAFEFELPDVGEGVAEGELVEWHVTVGDHVEEDEVLAEVETDKAVVDLPSPVTGTVRELHAEEGEMVPVGDVVVTIDVDDDVPEADESEIEEGAAAVDNAGAEQANDGEQVNASEQSGDGETAASAGNGRVFAPPNVRRLARELGVDIATVNGSGPGGRVTDQDVREAAGKGGSDDEDVASAVSQVSEDSKSGDGAGDDGPKAAVSKRSEGTKSAVSRADSGKSGRKSATRRIGQKTETGTDDAAARAAETADRDRTLAAPSTRRLAEEEGIDIDSVPTEKRRDGEPYVEPEDVRAYAEAQQAAQEADAAAVSEADDAGTATATEETVSATAGTTEGEVTREPYRGIRRTIGNQMEQSVYTAPHVTHHDTAVVDELVATRADLKERAAERGVSLTYLPFVMKAVVAALKEFPVLNTTLDEENEEVVYKHFYNIGVAVATDAGLMVPVVDNVDEKGIVDLASETTELAERARDRDLAREEMQGGTFTITNFGAIGGEYATPIINYPETAILGLGSIEQRPIVVESETAASSRASGDAANTGEVVAAHTLPLSLSIDHRVIDGAEAARFANTVIEYLENPTLLLLG